MSTILLLLHVASDVAQATAYTLDGPTTATTGVPSDDFVVALGPGELGDPVVVTPDDGGAGGTFTVVSVTLTNTGRTALFRYTPVAAGTVTISVTNDDALDDPAPIILTVTDPAAADDVTHGPIIMLKPAPGRWFHRGP